MENQRPNVIGGVCEFCGKEARICDHYKGWSDDAIKAIDQSTWLEKSTGPVEIKLYKPVDPKYTDVQLSEEELAKTPEQIEKAKSIPTKADDLPKNKQLPLASPKTQTEDIDDVVPREVIDLNEQIAIELGLQKKKEKIVIDKETNPLAYWINEKLKVATGSTEQTSLEISDFIKSMLKTNN